MRPVHTVAEIRAAEEIAIAAAPTGAVMQRAAAGLAAESAHLLDGCYGARVVLLVGAGNNGGDALFAGARLARRGARVSAVLIDPSRAHAEGLHAVLAAGGRVADALPSAVLGADLVIDGIVGIGGRGGLRGSAAELASAAEDALTVAVDVPSGVDADTGAVGDAAVRADVTVTFGALKPGVVSGAGAEYAGLVRLVDIGLPLPDATTFVLEERDVRVLLPVPEATDDKYTRGVVGVVAGSTGYPGAGVLATGAAAVGGAGFVRYAGTAADAVRARHPEVVVSGEDPRTQHVQAWIVGPGMGTDDDAAALLASVLAADVPALVDADGLTLVAAHPDLVRDRRAATVLTPHDREFARLAGAVGVDRIAAARRAAVDFGACVLLKGNATVVADVDGTVFVNPTGTPWLGTAGSGDVLSGLIGSLLAAGLSPALAAAAGAYVHGVAGQLAAAGGPPTAVDVLAALRPALRLIERG